MGIIMEEYILDSTDSAVLEADLEKLAYTKKKYLSPKEIAEFAETLMPDTGGIGIYDNFCHIDVRVVKSRWNG